MLRWSRLGNISHKLKRSPFAAGKDINVAQLAKNLYELQGQFAESQESIRKLKRRVRELEKNREGRVAVCEPRYNGNTMEELRATVVLETSTFKAARRLLTQLFSKDDLLSHSVSGKAPNRMTPPKPRFPEDKFLVYKDLMRGRFPEMKDKDMVEKVHHVQKGLKKV